MEKIESPCLSRQDGQKGPCPHKEKEKNSETCTNCERRIAYATDEGMIHENGMIYNPPRPLPQVIDKVEKKPICVEDGCEDDAEIRDRCNKHYQKWRKANPDKMGKVGRPPKEPKPKEKLLRREYSDIELCAKHDPRKGELLATVRKIAHIEYRSVHSQAFYLVKVGIEEWKKKHKQLL